MREGQKKGTKRGTKEEMLCKYMYHGFVCAFYLCSKDAIHSHTEH